MNGKIFIVGIGPGEEKQMSGLAYETLKSADVIVGYQVYVDLVRNLFPETEFKTTPMRQEIERCKLCFELALEGKKVAMICSGDAGVYGMAAPIYELSCQYSKVDIEVVAGITAASSGAAVLGAPLNHDFCVVSLSDLLTPWEVIENRLRAGIMGDFAMVLYNPSSHKRVDYLKRACEVMKQAGAGEDRACGFVENIGRDGQNTWVGTLKELSEKQVNMFTTVFIGNSKSEIIGEKLVTKRGYQV